jgi:hypothetical protein
MREEDAKKTRWRLHSCISSESCRRQSSRGQVAGEGLGVSVGVSVSVSVDADVSVGGGHRRGSGKDGRRERAAQGCKRDLAARVTDRRNNLQRGGSERDGDCERSEGAGAVDGVSGWLWVLVGKATRRGFGKPALGRDSQPGHAYACRRPWFLQDQRGQQLRLPVVFHAFLHCASAFTARCAVLPCWLGFQ